MIIDNRVIAVDFDGTISKGRFPEIGPPRKWLIDDLIKLRKNGCKLILWTCREDVAEENYLTDAVVWAKE